MIVIFAAALFGCGADIKAENEKLKKLARDVGYYVFMTNSDEWKQISSDKSKTNKFP
jgi:predicted MPP superfamily phosphohydrolase